MTHRKSRSLVLHRLSWCGPLVFAGVLVLVLSRGRYNHFWRRGRGYIGTRHPHHLYRGGPVRGHR